VPTAKEARKSVVWAIWLIGIFYVFTLVLGYGAAALVGPETIAAAPGGPNSAAPLLAFSLGGPLLLGLISAVAFATILAVVAGLTITAAASFAHDIYASVVKKGKPEAGAEVKVARRTVVIIGVVAIIGGIGANGQNIAFLVALAFAVAASANLPTIVYSLFWKRFTTRGALWSMYGGLISAIVLIAFSPVVSGSATSMLKTEAINFAIFPLSNPGTSYATQLIGILAYGVFTFVVSLGVWVVLIVAWSSPNARCEQAARRRSKQAAVAVTLDAVDQLNLPALRRYALAMQRREAEGVIAGGFHGFAFDQEVDVEYTFYGLALLALCEAYLSEAPQYAGVTP
jgi:Na+/proline symporter